VCVSKIFHSAKHLRAIFAKKVAHIFYFSLISKTGGKCNVFLQKIQQKTEKKLNGAR
jgi:hypothetical protein